MLLSYNWPEFERRDLLCFKYSYSCLALSFSFTMGINGLWKVCVYGKLVGSLLTEDVEASKAHIHDTVISESQHCVWFPAKYTRNAHSCCWG